MAYSENPYLKESLNKKKEAVLKELEAKKLLEEEKLKKEKQARNASDKTAAAQYMTASDPYGYEAEHLAHEKIGDSGISKTARKNAYERYIKKTEASKDEYESMRGEVYARLASEQQSGQADILKAESAYYDDIYSDYWKDKNFVYKLERAAVSDAKAASKSAGRSSSGGSSSKSSSSTSTKIADPYVYKAYDGTDYVYIRKEKSGAVYEQYKMNVFTQNAMYLLAMTEATALTEDGAHPPSAKDGKAFMKKAQREYKLSNEQLEKLSRYLASASVASNLR